MVSRASLVTITRTEIWELCKRLGHDPAKVARITIEPHVVVVEYEHPVMDGEGLDDRGRQVVQHPTVDRPPPRLLGDSDG